MIPPASCSSTMPSSLEAVIRSFRLGRTLPNSTRSPRACARRRSRHCSRSAQQADGVRCDMAMLLVNEIFARTWGGRAGDPPPEEYWTNVIGAVRAANPGFLFVAEAYWDLEWQLQQLGFDYCYDKRLYDRLVHESPQSVRGHLHADLSYQSRLVRFLENHDEPRIAKELLGDRERAAAVADRDTARRHALARGPVRRLAGSPPGLPRAPSARAGRRRSALVLPPPTRRPPLDCDPGSGRFAKRSAGQTIRAVSSSSAGVGRMANAEPWSSSMTVRRPPQRESACPGPTSPVGVGGSLTSCRAKHTSATVTK